MQKRWVNVVIAIVVVIVLIIVVVPFLVNAETFRPVIQEKLSQALGRQVTFGHLSFSLLSGSLVAKDIAISDDPAFSTSPFLKANELDVGVEVMPLLFHHQLSVTKFVVDSPAIQLIQKQNGRWNFSSIGGASPQPASPQPTQLPDLTVDELRIKNGSATVSSIPPTARPFVYSGVNVDVKQFSFAKSFPFDLSAKLPADGSLKLNGSAGPLARNDASETPFHASLQLSHFDPVAGGVIEGSKGISMIDDVDAQMSSNGTTVSSEGKVKAAKLQLSRTGSPAPQPVDIDYRISDDLRSRTGKISDIAVHSGSVAAHVTGAFRFTPQAVVLDLHLSAPNLPVDQVEQLLPVVGIRLPSGSSLHGGTLTANMAVTGPATEATISGPAELDNTQLAGFDLGSKIEGLSRLTGTGGGTGGGTQIQTVKATIKSTPQSTEISDIYGNVPAIGTATGSGTVSASGALNFNMVANLSSNNMVGAAINSAVNSARTAAGNAVGGLLGGILGKKSSNAPTTTAANRGIPLTITGTTTSPSIRANIGAMLK